MKIISLNVRLWTRDNKKSANYWKTRFKAIRKMFEKEQPDIICLQEALFPTSCFVIPKGYKRAGVSFNHPIFVKKEFTVSNCKFTLSANYATITQQGVSYRFANIHSTWFFDKFKKDMENVVVDFEKDCYPYIACGDFNETLDMIKKTDMNTMFSAREKLGIGEDEDTFQDFEKPSKHGAIDHFMCAFITPYFYDRLDDNYGLEGKRYSDHWGIELTFS